MFDEDGAEYVTLSITIPFKTYQEFCEVGDWCYTTPRDMIVADIDRAIYNYKLQTGPKGDSA